MSARHCSQSYSNSPHDHPNNSGLEFTNFYRRHFSFVIANVRRLGVTPYDAEDATQLVFLTAYRRRNSFSRSGSPRAWLYGIARKVASSHRRSHRRRSRKHIALFSQPQFALDKDLERQFESCEIVEQLLGQIDENKREVFILAELYDMSGIEIAQALGIKPSTVASRIHHARLRFSKIVQSTNTDDPVQFGSQVLKKIRKQEAGYDRYKNKCLIAFVPTLLQPSESSASLLSEFFSRTESQIAIKLKLMSKAVIFAAVGGTLFGIVPQLSSGNSFAYHSPETGFDDNSTIEKSHNLDNRINRSHQVCQTFIEVLDRILTSRRFLHPNPRLTATPTPPPKEAPTNTKPTSKIKEPENSTTTGNSGAPLETNSGGEEQSDESGCKARCKMLDETRPPFGSCVTRCEERYNLLRGDFECKERFFAKNECLSHLDRYEVLSYLKSEPYHPCSNQEKHVNECLRLAQATLDAALN